MRDVADLAGVSLNVVSRVCRPDDKEYVSTGARERVLAAIEQLGYYPDSRARSLRSLRAQTIGFFSAYGWLYVEEEFARAIFEGLQTGCGEADQDLLLFHGVDIRSIREAVRELVDAKVDGVVYLPKHGDTELTEALLQTRKPIVRIGEPYPRMPAVVAEDRDGARRLARHLYLRGHRHVVFRKPSFRLESATRRYEGFCEAAEELGMAVTTTVTDSPTEALSAPEQALLRRFRAEGITAVACWRDGAAAEVLVFCRKHRIHVPEDLAVVGFDGLTPENCPADLRLTTVVIDWQRIAETAVARLLDLVEGKPVPDEIVQPCSVYVGNTT